MDSDSIWIQVQSFLQRGLGFSVSARHVQQVSKAQMRIGTKRVERDCLLLKLDCLIEIAQHLGRLSVVASKPSCLAASRIDLM